MTQALINTLNILSDKQLTFAEKLPKSEGMDFCRIFETKTSDFVPKTNELYKNSEKENSAKKHTTCENKQELLKNPTVKKDQDINNKEIKNNNKNQTSKDKDENEDKQTDNVTLQGIIEGLIKEDVQETDDTASVSESAELLNDEEEETVSNITTDEEADADETTNTNEDSTMYKELITLENPTAVLMLQAQVTQTASSAPQNEKAETMSENLMKSQTNLQNLKTDDDAVFKQFDAVMAKDTNIINTAAKPVAQMKADTSKTTNVLNENMIKELNAQVISSQSSDTEASMGDLMQNQSPQEQTARIMIQGDVKYEAVAEAAKTVSQLKTTNISPSKIIDQIVKQMESSFNNSKLNMVLNPGSLGKLNLQLINTKEGLIAQFTVMTQEARDILMKGLEGLKESLLAQGVNIDNVSVKLEETENEYKQDYTEQEGSKGGNKHQNQKKQKESGKDFEEMMFNLEKDGNV